MEIVYLQVNSAKPQLTCTLGSEGLVTLGSTSAGPGEDREVSCCVFDKIGRVCVGTDVPEWGWTVKDSKLDSPGFKRKVNLAPTENQMRPPAM